MHPNTHKAKKVKSLLGLAYTYDRSPQSLALIPDSDEYSSNITALLIVTHSEIKLGQYYLRYVVLLLNPQFSDDTHVVSHIATLVLRRADTVPDGRECQSVHTP